MELIEVQIERVIATTDDHYAAVLKAPEKTFLIFIGRPEALALYRSLKGRTFFRPLAHDLIANLMAAFDIKVRGVVISTIIDNIFCATLLLSQAEDQEGQRHEVRLDLRASDAMIVARKTGSQLFVSQEVLDAVQDASGLLGMDDGLGEMELDD